MARQSIEITDLTADDTIGMRQAAKLLVDGFREHYPDAWPTVRKALATVRQAVRKGNICRAARDGDGTVIGWIGGLPSYRGRVWELHPLVVRRDRGRRGIGRALVEDLEEQVRLRGGLTLWLGTDDEDDMTTLGGVDLYPDILEKAMVIEDRRGHPFVFYRKVGFVIAGVLPDANGFGKPDIFMAKRVGPRPEAG